MWQFEFSSTDRSVAIGLLSTLCSVSRDNSSRLVELSFTSMLPLEIAEFVVDCASPMASGFSTGNKSNVFQIQIASLPAWLTCLK